MADGPAETSEAEYAERLLRLQGIWWKRILNVQAPYGWNLRRLNPGRTLEIGCGIGRNLAHLRGAGVGIDHNRRAVEICRRLGFVAFIPSEFPSSIEAANGAFDSILFSHVIEHTSPEEANSLLATYVPYLRPQGQLIFETPQEVGFRSDSSHRRFVDFDDLSALSTEFGATIDRAFSFPFPRPVGRLFVYNEFVVTARLEG